MINRKSLIANGKYIPLIFLILLISLFPFFTYAAGLVPCGGPGENPCTLCHLFQLISNIIHFILKSLLLPLAILGFLAGGIMILFAGGSESQLEKGKSVLWSTVIGIFIAFAAWLIVNTIIQSIANPDFKGANDIKWAWEKFPGCQ